MLEKNMINEKAGISYLEICLLIISIFAFSYIVYETSRELGVVSAQEDFSLRCCPETNDGNICQDVPSDYEECKDSLLPTSCEQVSSCKLGCCFDEQEGLCSSNSPKQRCEQDTGKLKDNSACNILECRLGCCVLGNEAQYITENRCEKLSSFHGSEFDYRQEVSELECLNTGKTQTQGACVLEVEDNGNIVKSCEFTTQQKCLQRTGNSLNFYENSLCTNPELKTICQPTKNTVCAEGKDEVYFVDSCGNIANIYDSTKVDDKDYWSKVVSKGNSCSVQGKNCGNCNYPENKCFKYRQGEDEKLEHGDFTCRNLNCEDAPDMIDALGKLIEKKDRKNGESWCVYDSYIGEGKDVVGSRHFKYYCYEGEVKNEPCADFRQEICTESKDDSLTNAECRINRWRECLDINSMTESSEKKIDYNEMIQECEGTLDCYVQNTDVDEQFKFSMCIPQYPTGFDLNDNLRGELAKQTCAMASQDCIVVYVKTMSGWKCALNCDCESSKFTQQMNDLCIGLGDCGGYINILGKEDDAYSVKNAPKIKLNQYQKYKEPVEGQKASPDNLTGFDNKRLA